MPKGPPMFVDFKQPAESADDKLARLLAAGRKAREAELAGKAPGPDVPGDGECPGYPLPPKQFYKAAAEFRTIWVRDNWPELCKGTEDEVNAKVCERVEEIKARGWG